MLWPGSLTVTDVIYIAPAIKTMWQALSCQILYNVRTVPICAALYAYIYA